jgi:hypothetical protein
MGISKLVWTIISRPSLSSIAVTVVRVARVENKREVSRSRREMQELSTRFPQRQRAQEARPAITSDALWHHYGGWPQLPLDPSNLSRARIAVKQ